jgi:pimeloyl-ACP methyl ester carboxylesterase
MVVERLHVVRFGGAASSVPFLLVHGLASNALMWSGVGDALAQAGHPAAAVDLRGHGRSPKPLTGYGFAEVVGDLVALIDSLGWSSDVVLAGQSWGGNVVLELAASGLVPGLRGVACVDGGWIELQGEFPAWEDCATRLAPPVLEGLAAAELEARVRSFHPDWPESGIQGLLANFEVRPDGTVAPWLTRDRHMEILRALWEHRPPLLYASVDVPVLLLPAGPKALASSAAAALPKGTLEPIEGDHDLHAQHPGLVAQALLDWLPS